MPEPTSSGFFLFTWHVLLGSVIVFGIGYSSSLLLPSHDDAHAATD